MIIATLSSPILQNRGQVIRDMAGHVSRDMVKHYSHIRTEAKRRAVEALTSRAAEQKREHSQFSDAVVQEMVQVGLFSRVGFHGSRDFIGSPGRIRTYNPSVNSRMLCH